MEIVHKVSLPINALDWTRNGNESDIFSRMETDKNWPVISVITPSFNQGQFLERTIRSVLLQGYPNLEYIIIDGGSSDESVSIIKKYEHHLAYWVSEKDQGQSQAINKGFIKATGSILCWLNSDDFFMPNTLFTVAETLADGTNNYALVGHCLKIYTDEGPPELLRGNYSNYKRLVQFWKGNHMHQPAIFWRREVFDKVGLLDEELFYIMDFDYWVRIAKWFTFKNVDSILACATYHPQAKTGDNYHNYSLSLIQHGPKYWGSRKSLNFWYYKFSLFNEQYFVTFYRRCLGFLHRRYNFFRQNVIVKQASR